MNIPIKKFNDKAVVPTIATAGAACMDVVATEIIYNEPGKVTVKLGFATEIPEGYKAVVSPRSSFTHKDWVLQNSPCQIDSDYRGEWMIRFQAIPVQIDGWTNGGGRLIDTELKYKDFPYEVGDRVAQMWIEKVMNFEFKEVEELSNTSRGDGGFGSTGK